MYIALKLRVKQITYKSTIQTDNTNRPKPEENQLKDLKNLRILPENSAEGLGSRRERC